MSGSEFNDRMLKGEEHLTSFDYNSIAADLGVSLDSVTWSTSDDSVISISNQSLLNNEPKAMLSALKAGSATIICEAHFGIQDITSLLTIHVADPTLELVSRVNAPADDSDVRSIMATMYGLDLLEEQPVTDFVKAMNEAWLRLNQLSFDTGVPDVFELESLTDEQWAEIPQSNINKMIRAVLVEANIIVGADPVGDRRRSGLLSDSNGESAQFFRQTRPFDAPMTKDALKYLSGLVLWGPRIGR